MRVLLFAALALLLFGCGSSAPPKEKPADQTLRLDTDAAQLAVQKGRPEEAIARYQEALTRAQAGDDLGAIENISYNLAVAELQANHPDQALNTARGAEQEVARRGGTPLPELILVEATALYRTGDLAAADAKAKAAASGGNAETKARATFLRGLIADERNDVDGLAASSGSLGPTNDPSLQADKAELSARLSLRHGNTTQAEQAAAQAAALRRQTLDYRGLVRALALEGEANERAGRAAKAADLYFQAGRSAAAQDDKGSARAWLNKALAVSTDDAVRSEVTALLAKIGS